MTDNLQTPLKNPGFVSQPFVKAGIPFSQSSWLSRKTSVCLKPDKVAKPSISTKKIYTYFLLRRKLREIIFADIFVFVFIGKFSSERI